jgi:NAD-dependent SIR2 family protein deacetylase
MKTYRHFKVTCLACGSVWEETSAEPVTVRELKLDIPNCEDCGIDMIQVSGM